MALSQGNKRREEVVDFETTALLLRFVAMAIRNFNYEGTEVLFQHAVRIDGTGANPSLLL